MRFCHKPNSLTFAFIGLISLGLAGCSSESMDRLGCGTGSKFSAGRNVATVAPMENYQVSRTELPGNTNNFASRTNFRSVPAEPTYQQAAPAPTAQR